MLPSAWNLRLQQLESNVTQILKLLNEYEEELLHEDNPGIRSKYRRRIESLKQQKFEYEKEFEELKIQRIDGHSLQTHNLSEQLQEIDNKIELLLDNQVALSQALLSHFSPEEQNLILPFTQQLDSANLIQIQAFIEAVDTNKVSDEEIQLVLTETQELLKVIKEHNLSLPAASESIVEIVNSPTIDAKHALKVSIPIIPFILAYEGEIGLGTGINLKETWQHLKSKFRKN
jgi:hypothetical protein